MNSRLFRVRKELNVFSNYKSVRIFQQIMRSKAYNGNAVPKFFGERTLPASINSIPFVFTIPIFTNIPTRNLTYTQIRCM